MLDTFFQALIMAFREGLEAFLLVGVLLRFLHNSQNKNLEKAVWGGATTAVGISILIGIGLWAISHFLGGASATGKLWESIASFIAVLFIVTLIVFMINHGSKIKDHVEKKAKLALSATGIFFLSFFLVAREGVEMALFSFAGNYALLPLLIGLVGALILVLLIHHSLLKVRLKTLFIITLAYLILQAGFLMGYSIHEGLSAAKELDVLSANSVLYVKAFDLSNTVLYHKEGVIGVPLYVLIGWYSSPEWIQFIIQYVLTAGLFLYWYVVSNKSSKNSVPSSIKSPPAPKNQRARQNKPFSKKSKHHKTSKG